MERTTFLRLSEVEKHRVPGSYWIIINNFVYDVTGFTGDHPGGPEILKQSGGKDVTDAFLTKGNSGHSTKAVSMLKNFLVGELHPQDRTRDVPTYTLAEVAQHKTNGDYWFAIHNKVYNVSAFLGEHPGGMEPLKQHSGTDASKAFDEVGHTHDAKTKLKRMYVGELHPRDCEAVSAAAQAKYVAPSLRDPVAVRGPDPVKAHIRKQIFTAAVTIVFLYCCYQILLSIIS
jgi:cytochrome b involved in lipid metabolism